MRNALLIAALCLGVFSSSAAQARDMTAEELKDCFKQPLAAECVEHFEQLQKVLEDISKGRKPTINLPISPDSKSFPLGELGKLLSID
jgi:hypothetical protein